MVRTLALLGLLTLPLAAQEQLGIAHGQVPEAVTLEDLNGTTVDLGQWIGQRPMVVEFWATWCPLCAELEPKLIAWHITFGERVQFVAVAVGVNQRPRTITRHLERHPLPFPVLYDARGRAARAFMAPTTSYIVVLDRDGKVVYTGSGADQDLRAILEAVTR